MKTKLSVLVISVILAQQVKAFDNPSTVITFYSSLEQLSNTTDFNVANSAQQRMAFCFAASDDSGIRLSMDGMKEMTSTLYTMRLCQMIFQQKSLTMKKYNILKTETVEQPDQNSNMQKSGVQHYITYVEKTYHRNGVATTYNDLVFTLISNGLIVEMCNSELQGNNPSPINRNDSYSIEQLRARAAYAYSKGDYNKAYAYYEEIMHKAPTDGDAAYRIALLTFWRKGCKDRFKKKEAEKIAKQYLSIALRYGNQEIVRKANNVSANWENKNIYF